MLCQGPIAFDPPPLRWDPNPARRNLRLSLEERFPHKLCYCCGILRPTSCYRLSFKTADGFQPYCNACGNTVRLNPLLSLTKRYRDQKSAEGKQQRQKYPQRDRARRVVTNARRRNQITPDPCWYCNDPNSESHHPDHSKPREIQWLCLPCHRAADILLR